MMNGKNLKVGFLFLTFLALLFTFTIIIKGGFKGLFYEGRTLVCSFENVENLKSGDKVLFAGVPVGKVTDIIFHSQYVEVHMIIKEEQVIIYQGAEFVVEDVSMLGGKQVSISRGDPLKGEIDWKEVQTGRAVPVLSEAVQSATTSFTQTIEENRKNIDMILVNLKETTANINEITRKANRSEGSVGKFLNEPELYDNLNQTASNINSLVSKVERGEGSIGPLFNNPDLYERIEYITRQMHQGRGLLGQMLVNEALYNNVEGIVINVERITRSIDEGHGTLGRLVNDPGLYDNLDAIVTRLNRGEGTLGKLLTDEILFNEVKEIVGNLKGVTKSLQNVSRKMDEGRGTVGKLVNDTSLFNKAEEAVDSARDILGAFKKFHTYVGAGYKYHGKQKLSVGRVYIRVEPSPSKFLQVGASWLGFSSHSHDVMFEGKHDGDTSDDIFFQMEALMGFRFFENHLTLRMGLLEGQFGGGVDFDVDLPYLQDSQLRFSFEGRVAFADTDFDGTEIDEDVEPFVARFEASLFLFGHFRLYAGAHNFFDRIGFTGGVSFEWHDEDIRDLVGLISLAG